MGLNGYQEVIGPRFFLETSVDAKGRPIPSLADDIIPYINSFEYEDGDTHFIDCMKIMVANPGLRFKDDPRFKEGARFRVRFGYVGNISDAKNAVISKARPHYPQNGMPIIEMVAFNLQQDMNKQKNPYNYGPVSSSSIAATIAARYNFGTDIEESNDQRSQARVQPAGLTDIQYLIHLSSKLNWDCYIEGTLLHFHPKRFSSPSNLEFTYFTDNLGTLINFEVDMNMNSLPATSVVGASTKTGNAASGSGPSDNKYRIGVVQVNESTRLVSSNPGGPKNNPGQGGVSVPTSESDSRVVGIQGAAYAQAIDMSAIKATATVIGNPQVRARTMIRISGIDQQYTGNWRVAKSRHLIEPRGVYRTYLHLNRDSGDAKSKTQNQQNTKKQDALKKVHQVIARIEQTRARVFSP